MKPPKTVIPYMFRSHWFVFCLKLAGHKRYTLHAHSIQYSLLWNVSIHKLVLHTRIQNNRRVMAETYMIIPHKHSSIIEISSYSKVKNISFVLGLVGSDL